MGGEAARTGTMILFAHHLESTNSNAWEMASLIFKSRLTLCEVGLRLPSANSQRGPAGGILSLALKTQNLKRRMHRSLFRPDP